MNAQSMAVLVSNENTVYNLKFLTQNVVRKQILKAEIELIMLSPSTTINLAIHDDKYS